MANVQLQIQITHLLLDLLAPFVEFGHINASFLCRPNWQWYLNMAKDNPNMSRLESQLLMGNYGTII